jgi:hypothetical protein
MYKQLLRLNFKEKYREVLYLQKTLQTKYTITNQIYTIDC